MALGLSFKKWFVNESQIPPPTDAPSQAEYKDH